MILHLRSDSLPVSPVAFQTSEEGSGDGDGGSWPYPDYGGYPGYPGGYPGYPGYIPGYPGLVSGVGILCKIKIITVHSI